MDADQGPPQLDHDADGQRRSRGASLMTPAVGVSLLLLVTSAALAVSFVAATGGLHLPGPSATDVAVLGSPTPETAAPSPSPGPSAPAPTPGPTPAPTPTSSPSPDPGPTAGPTSDRYQYLEPCPNRTDCYLYTVLPGNNLRSIANYFGVSYETVLALNPAITDPNTIQPGDVLVLPPPTR